jgi:ribosomal protein S18 acetylase RimI-like enzyme
MDGMPAIPEECIVKAGADFLLVAPVPAPLRRAAAEYSAAQRATLNRVIGGPDVRREILGGRLRADRICLALVNGTIAGCISYRVDGAGSIWPDPSLYRTRFGPLGGTLRYLLTEATLRRGRRDELYIEGFKVDAAARGRGIGTALLEWVGAETVRLGKSGWRTEVSVAAEGAIRLYGSVGAKPVRTVSLGPVGALFNRPSFVVMRWDAPAGGRPPADPRTGQPVASR